MRAQIPITKGYNHKKIDIAEDWKSVKCGFFNRFGEINNASGHNKIGIQNPAIAQLNPLNPSGISGKSSFSSIL